MMIVQLNEETSQIEVRCGGKTYYLDLGWRDLKIAIEYDGDHHRTDRAQFARDIARLEDLARLGWIVIRVAAGTSRHEILARLSRAWKPQRRVPRRYLPPLLQP